MTTSQFTRTPAGLASVMGKETRDANSRERVFQLAGGMHPGTLIQTSPLPYAVAPTQYNAKGTLRVRFYVLVDGTVEFLAKNGITGMDQDSITWYCVTVSRNVPLKDNHPATFTKNAKGEDVPASWTQDATEIAKYLRSPGRMAEANVGGKTWQTLYGVFLEAKALKFVDRAKGITELDWDMIVGRRVMVTVNEDGWGDKIIRASLSDGEIATLDKENPQYLLGDNPAAVVTFRKWPAKKMDEAADDQGNSTHGGSATARVPVFATDGMKQWLIRVTGELNKLASDNKKTVAAIIQAAAASEGSGAIQFTKLETVGAQVQVLAKVAVLAQMQGIDITLPEDAWAADVRNFLAIESTGMGDVI